MLKNRIHMFLAASKTGSFSKAAEQLYMTPSAVNQQIRSLERDLNCTLFTRDSKGTRLTPEGEYLAQEAMKMADIESQVKREILRIQTQETEICVGTSLLERCQLFYNLWVLYSKETPGQKIKMVMIDPQHQIPEETDVIESVSSGVDWMHQWSFLEICRVPFVFGVTRDHPLAQKKIISLDDLKDETVLTINDGTCQEIKDMLETLQTAGIHVTLHKEIESTGILESAFRRQVLLAPQCWRDILINMTLVPCHWDYSIPYGFFYRPQPRPAVQHFLDYVTRACANGNTLGFDPVF